MKVRHAIIAVSVAIIGLLVSVGGASALTEQSSVEVKFQFSSMLTMSVSGDELTIGNLMPGSTATSNEITVTVMTNNALGYEVTATAGNVENATTDLLHTNGTTKFSSITPGTKVEGLTDGGTWGYSTDSGASFSGLPLYTQTGATLNETSGANASSETKFMISALAKDDQLAGDYSNVINISVMPKVVASGS